MYTYIELSLRKIARVSKVSMVSCVFSGGVIVLYVNEAFTVDHSIILW